MHDVFLSTLSRAMRTDEDDLLQTPIADIAFDSVRECCDHLSISAEHDRDQARRIKAARQGQCYSASFANASAFDQEIIGQHQSTSSNITNRDLRRR